MIGDERVDSVTYSPYVLQLRATSVKVGDIRLVENHIRLVEKRSVGASVFFSTLVTLPYTQPNTEIRKPNRN